MTELRTVRDHSGLTHSGSLLLQGLEGLIFPAGGSLALPPVNCISSLGAVSPELDRTSGTQLTREGKMACTGLCSVGEL